MTLTPEIIQSAYRESNLVAIGATLTDAQTTEALKRLNVLVSGAYGNEVGDPLVDWPIGTEGVTADYPTWSADQWNYPLGNARLIASDTAANTVYLPADPSDGQRVAVIDPASRLATYPITLDGNGRTIEGTATVVLSTDALNRTWFYRADLGNWVILTDLTGDVAEEFPFPMEFDDYFIIRLAMRLNPRYGRTIDEATAATMELALRKLRARYRQQRVIPCDEGVLNLTRPVGFWDTARVSRGRLGWMS